MEKFFSEGTTSYQDVQSLFVIGQIVKWHGQTGHTIRSRFGNRLKLFIKKVDNTEKNPNKLDTYILKQRDIQHYSCFYY